MPRAGGAALSMSTLHSPHTFTVTPVFVGIVMELQTVNVGCRQISELTQGGMAIEAGRSRHSRVRVTAECIDLMKFLAEAHGIGHVRRKSGHHAVKRIDHIGALDSMTGQTLGCYFSRSIKGTGNAGMPSVYCRHCCSGAHG